MALDTGLGQLAGGEATGIPSRIVVAKGVDGVIVIDSDDYLYIGGACPDFGPKGKPKRSKKTSQSVADSSLVTATPSGQPCGIGFSLGGNISFEYATVNLP
ncbi:MAG: hypothetical protein V3V01_05570, partial [Acidimicrobiales bacterium]